MTNSFPPNVYAEMAPLPAPLADHLFRYWQRHHRTQDVLYQLVKEVREKQRYAYVFLDSYVRNREKSSPRELRLSTELVRTTLGLYTPQKRPIPPKTFTYWIDSGYIRMKSKGYPEPDSAAALVVLRLLMETKSLLPSEPMNPEETWWCYAQSGPDEAIQAVPLSAVEDLPPYTLLWTGWAGAAWSESHTWMPIGDGFGAIRFTKPAITRPRQHSYELTALLRWKPDLEAQYQPQPGCELDMVNALEHLALVHLACNRVVSPSLWNKERLYAGQSTGTGLLRRSR